MRSRSVAPSSCWLQTTALLPDAPAYVHLRSTINGVLRPSPTPCDLVPWTPAEREEFEALKRTVGLIRRDVTDVQSGQTRVLDQHTHSIASMTEGAVVNITKAVKGQLDAFDAKLAPKLDPILEVLPTVNDVHAELVAQRGERHAQAKEIAVAAALKAEGERSLALYTEQQERDRQHRRNFWIIASGIFAALAALAGVVFSSYHR